MELTISCALLFVACFTSLNAGLFTLFNEHKNPCAYLYVHADSLNAVHIKNGPYQALFDYELLCAEAAHKNLPLVCIIPIHREGFSPISAEGVAREDARVALAWTSIAHRFNHVPIRIIETSRSYTPEEICSLAYSALSFRATLNNSPEENVSAAIISAESLTLQKSPYFCRPWTPYYKNPGVKIFDAPVVQNCARRIVITGGAGFIAHHLIARLLERGDQVIALDSLICSDLKNIQPFLTHPHFTFIKADCTQPFTITGPITDIIHAASIPSPEFYYRLPHETMRAGLRGTLNCLRLATKKNARFLFTSTSEVYGDPEISPQPESYHGRVSATGKRCQYDQSKRGSEMLIAHWIQDNQLDVRIARIFNTYGPGMQLNDGRVVTNFIAAALANKPLHIYGDGSQTRSFGYVADTVDGLIRLLDAEFEPERALEDRIYNIGTPAEFTIRELAEIFTAVYMQECGHAPRIEFMPNPDATDPRQRLPDITAAHRDIGFTPRTLLREGLLLTLRSFLAPPC